MEPRKLRMMISGGGTGGHIFPALAIADACKNRFGNVEIEFVGALGRMEMEKVPAAGYPIKGIPISGIQRTDMLKNLSFPVKLLRSLWICKRLIKSFKPDIVVGTGGFASGPLLFVAANKGIPCLIQEQNSFPGLTNKWLAKKVQKICVAYAGLERWFPASKIVFTGNPVRKKLLESFDKQISKQAFGLDSQKPVLLITGGSLGARKVNEVVAEHLEIILNDGIQVIWQCGSLYADALKEKYQNQTGLWLDAFIANMGHAYAAADVVVARAGAGTLSELAVAGKAAILIPSPNVAEDHQTKNAKALSSQGAAVLLPEQEAAKRFLHEVKQLLLPENRKNAEKSIMALAKPNATEEIVNEIEKLIKP
jgi:UDP-N-acetylglucosamine--N-acetylmuramyl-(pentapeptide) pyrophosphoryl-undecaprenol N-acetylglucosamine transferase